MTESVVELSDIEWNLDRVCFQFTVSGPAETMFTNNRSLTIYCSEGVTSDLTELAGTFLIAMAPVAWLGRGRVIVDHEVPADMTAMVRRTGRYLARHYRWDAHDASAGVRSVAIERYPALSSGLMFSGGVDSSAALLQLDSTADWLLHMSNFENLDGQMTRDQRRVGIDIAGRVAAHRGLACMHLRTNIASIFRHSRFDYAFPEGCSFWLGLEHVHHIVTAVSAIRLRLGRVYLAGGLNELTTAVGSVAANSSFLERYDAPVTFTMVDELVERQDKVQRLLDSGPDLLRTLRVCYSSGNSTCLSCLKCRATAMMILSGGGRLADTSFSAGIHSAIRAVITELSDVGPEGHRLFNQALDGRRLRGSRAERWAQLSALVDADESDFAERGGRSGGLVT
jgi:hypothetical protein